MQLSRAAAALVMTASIFGATSSRAEIKFCNEFPHLVYVAMAYQQTGGSYISRGWMGLAPHDCNVFDTALRVGTFYFRGESEPYKDPKGHSTKYNWGKGKIFAVFADTNFQIYDAEHKFPKSTFEEFTQGPQADSGDVSATITFKEGGSTMDVGN